MAHDPKVEAWLTSRRAGELERLRKLEEEAAEAWWGSLSPEQKEIYSELQDGGHGLYHLHNEIMSARLTTRRRREEKE